MLLVKLIEIDFHFVRDHVANGDLCVAYVSIEDQLTDLLTKLVPTQIFVTSYA